jgi:hypothetical protein
LKECNNPSPIHRGKYCLGNHNEKGTCSGEEVFLNNCLSVIFFRISVNGGWSEWVSWTCDKNTGEKERLKECNNPSPLHGGEYCLGNHNEKGTCSGEEVF